LSDQETHLTEIILAIQHEIQLALDYIETVVSQESSELGAASSLITMENMRVRIPFVFQTDEDYSTSKPDEETSYIPGNRLQPEEIRQLKRKLADRPGLYLGSQEGKQRFVKVRVTSPVLPKSGVGDDSPTSVEPLIGEIELKLTRIPRDLNSSPSDASVGTDPVPDVIGRNLDEAVSLLEGEGWEAKAHVAGEEEIAALPGVLPGRVLRQAPASGSRMDREGTAVHFWVVLSTLPVSEIDGIGPVRKSRLEETGIENVGELSLASVELVADAVGISKTRAQSFIDMANFMSRLNIAGLRDEVVEVLTKGVNIRSMEQLANASREELYQQSRQVVDSKQVRVPGQFTFTQDDVETWIQAARSSLGKS